MICVVMAVQWVSGGPASNATQMTHTLQANTEVRTHTRPPAQLSVMLPKPHDLSHSDQSNATTGAVDTTQAPMGVPVSIPVRQTDNSGLLVIMETHRE